MDNPLGPAVSLRFVIITLVITPSYHNLHARMGAIFMALNSCVHYGYLSQRITIPSTGSFKKEGTMIMRITTIYYS